MISKKSHTTLVQLGFSPLEIANRLRHGRVTTTIKTYCHPSMDAQERIAYRLSALEKDGESRDTKSGSKDTDEKDSGEE